MKISNVNFKVSFYLKKKVSHNGLSPVMGRIAIGRDMSQFSCKLEANHDLWDTRAGRVNGKSHHARMVNREIDKINVAVNAKYKEIHPLSTDNSGNLFSNVVAFSIFLILIRNF